MEWISVKDRLPEEDSMYLVFYNGNIDFSDFISEEKETIWWAVSDYENLPNMTKGVTHWMPLPDPPQ